MIFPIACIAFTGEWIMRTRNAVLVFLAVAAMVAVASLSEEKKPTLLLLDWANRGSKERPPAAVLIEMGAKDKQPEKWSGRAVVNGAKVVHREGYRFRQDDKLLDPDRWEVSSHRGLRVPPRNPAVSRREGIATIGIVLHLSDIADDASLSLTTAREGAEKAEVKLKDVLTGHAKELWGGKARVRLITTATPLTSGKTEDDFPAAAYGPDGTLWVAYISYKVRDESRRIEQKNFEKQPSDFKALYTPEFADQLFVKHFRDGKWSEPLAITGPKEDLMRCAITVDSSGVAFVVYSANRNGRYDLYARSIDKKVGEEQRLTGSSPKGTSPKDAGVAYLSPVVCTGETGRILACQGWSKKGNGGVFLAVYKNKPERGWSGGTTALISPENSTRWNFDVAVGFNDNFQFACDGYIQGDYDVLLPYQATIGKVIQKNIPAASSPRFEVRPSICYDAKGRLWIAYEEGPEKWGKDSGALAHGGDPLYSDRSVRVVCLDTDGTLKRPAELPTSHVGNPVRTAWSGRGSPQ